MNSLNYIKVNLKIKEILENKVEGYNFEYEKVDEDCFSSEWTANVIDAALFDIPVTRILAIRTDRDKHNYRILTNLDKLNAFRYFLSGNTKLDSNGITLNPQLKEKSYNDLLSPERNKFDYLTVEVYLVDDYAGISIHHLATVFEYM